MGLEPLCWERSTLGGWVASRATGLKHARYGAPAAIDVGPRVQQCLALPVAASPSVYRGSAQ